MRSRQKLAYFTEALKSAPSFHIYSFGLPAFQWASLCRTLCAKLNSLALTPINYASSSSPHGEENKGQAASFATICQLWAQLELRRLISPVTIATLPVRSTPADVSSAVDRELKPVGPFKPKKYGIMCDVVVMAALFADDNDLLQRSDSLLNEQIEQEPILSL